MLRRGPLLAAPLGMPDTAQPGMLPAQLQIDALSIAPRTRSQGLVVQPPGPPAELGVRVGPAQVGDAGEQLTGIKGGGAVVVVLGPDIEDPALLATAGLALPGHRGSTAKVPPAKPGLGPAQGELSRGLQRLQLAAPRQLHPQGVERAVIEQLPGPELGLHGPAAGGLRLEQPCGAKVGAADRLVAVIECKGDRLARRSKSDRAGQQTEVDVVVPAHAQVQLAQRLGGGGGTGPVQHGRQQGVYGRGGRQLIADVLRQPARLRGLACPALAEHELEQFLGHQGLWLRLAVGRKGACNGTEHQGNRLEGAHALTG